MYCSKCGKKLNDDDLYCSRCGTRIIETDFFENQMDEPKTHKAIWRRVLIGILIVAVLFTVSIAPRGLMRTSVIGGETVYVYITDTGSKYHRETCGYLHSKHKITLDAAKRRGYDPCSRCNPPL